MQRITDKLVDFVVSIKYEDLPPDVVHEAKRVFLDTAGCAIAGLSVDKGKLAVKLAKRFGGEPESTILGAARRVSCPSAAFANGELINALDMDPYSVSRHVPPLVVPAPLAIAETVGASGKELIMAIVLGHEIGMRMMTALTKYMTYEEDGNKIVLPPTGNGMSCAAFGGVAAAGRILKLDKKRMAYALGIAGHSCAVPTFGKWFRTTPMPLTKYCPAGFVSQAQVNAALLAEMGYAGDTDILDGEFGFWRMYAQDSWKPEVLFDGLGEKWYLMGMTHKRYPCTGAFYGVLESFLKIIEEHKLAPDDIQSVKAFLYPLCEEPIFRNNKLVTQTDAQFNLPYVFAVAAHRIKPGASWQEWDTMRDPSILNFMEKVTFTSHPDFVKLFLKNPDSRPTAVEVVAKGKTIKDERLSDKADPSARTGGVTDDELAAKFRRNSNRALTPENVEKSIDAMMSLEKVKDISTLLGYLS